MGARKSLNCRVTPLKSRRTRRQFSEGGILDRRNLDRELRRQCELLRRWRDHSTAPSTAKGII